MDEVVPEYAGSEVSYLRSMMIGAKGSLELKFGREAEREQFGTTA